MDVVDMISRVGFPIFMVLYYMNTTNKVLTENTNIIKELKASIDIMNFNHKIEKSEEK
jgi:hypothetical protein